LEGKALPLGRSEDMENINAIRVPLQAGVHFVAQLLLREEAAFPESVLAGPHISREPDHPFMKWEKKAQQYAEERLAHAQAQDKIDPFTTVEAVKKAVLVHRVDKYPLTYCTPSDFMLVGSEIQATLMAPYPEPRVVQYLATSTSKNCLARVSEMMQRIGFESIDGDTQDIMADCRCHRGRNTYCKIAIA
jgi:hypothetical protein